MFKNLYRLPGKSLRNAFTLVELLVVIAIIAILAALAFPTVGSMLNRATKAKDAGNVRNIAGLVLTYNADHAVLPGVIFRATRHTGYPNSTNYLDGFLAVRGYVPKSDSIWRSPSSYTTNTAYILNNTVNTDPVFFFGDASAKQAPKRLTALKANLKPSLKPAVTNNTPSLGNLWLVTNADGENYSVSQAEGSAAGHPTNSRTPWGGRHYAFFDGSVRFIPRQEPSIYPSAVAGRQN